MARQNTCLCYMFQSLKDLLLSQRKWYSSAAVCCSYTSTGALTILRMTFFMWHFSCDSSAAVCCSYTSTGALTILHMTFCIWHFSYDIFHVREQSLQKECLTRWQVFSVTSSQVFSVTRLCPDWFFFFTILLFREVAHDMHQFVWRWTAYATVITSPATCVATSCFQGLT